MERLSRRTVFILLSASTLVLLLSSSLTFFKLAPNSQSTQQKKVGQAKVTLEPLSTLIHVRTTSHLLDSLKEKHPEQYAQFMAYLNDIHNSTLPITTLRGNQKVYYGTMTNMTSWDDAIWNWICGSGKYWEVALRPIEDSFFGKHFNLIYNDLSQGTQNVTNNFHVYYDGEVPFDGVNVYQFRIVDTGGGDNPIWQQAYRVLADGVSIDDAAIAVAEKMVVDLKSFALADADELEQQLLPVLQNGWNITQTVVNGNIVAEVTDGEGEIQPLVTITLMLMLAA